MANFSQRNIKLVASLLLIPCVLFLFDTSSMVSRNLEVKENSSPYDMSCPLAIEGSMGVGPDVQGSLEYSNESGAQSMIARALESNGGLDGKIVMIGDSHTRQIFTSFVCIAHTAAYWKDDNAYTSAMVDIYNDDMYHDVRLKLKEGFGELFYAPTGGKINTYGWSGIKQPMVGNEDWLKSCRERKPFYLDAYTYDAANENQPYSEGDERFEKVLLGEKDIVFFNAGQHNTRESNVNNLTELLDCMDTARTNGDDLGWPQISYIISNQLHFNNLEEGGAHGISNDLYELCLEEVDRGNNPFLKQDKDIFGEKLVTAGFDLDLGKVGNFHIGRAKGPNLRTDCAHWTTPGVPDVLAKEIARSILITRMREPSRI